MVSPISMHCHDSVFNSPRAWGLGQLQQPSLSQTQPDNSHVDVAIKMDTCQSLFASADGASEHGLHALHVVSLHSVCSLLSVYQHACRQAGQR